MKDAPFYQCFYKYNDSKGLFEGCLCYYVWGNNLLYWKKLKNACKQLLVRCTNVIRMRRSKHLPAKYINNLYEGYFIQHNRS